MFETTWKKITEAIIDARSTDDISDKAPVDLTGINGEYVDEDGSFNDYSFMYGDEAY